MDQDNPSFADIKEKFKKINVGPYLKPPTASTIKNESLSADSYETERSKSESSNQSFGKI
jgi:hypothetical protein